MALAEPQASRATWRDRFYRWRVGLVGSRSFQRRAARLPIARRIAKRDGEALFDLVAGFVHSQVLLAFVEFDLPSHLAGGPRSIPELSQRLDVPEDRMKVLADAATALGLMERSRSGRYGLGRLGATLPGVPGLAQMIRHHDVLYRDLSDPCAFFRNGSDTELAAFWPYVFGAHGEIDPDVAATYSDLMADSQSLVAEEALAHLDLSGTRRLLDIGGGTGVFLAAAAERYPNLQCHLFDLPAVVPPASARFDRAGLSQRAQITAGSFRSDPLPDGADTISLVRVLYDHADETVAALLSKVHDTLPSGGRLVVAEPMRGNRAGDAYFGVYCLAMRTGRARSGGEIADLLYAAGFDDVSIRKTSRPFVTGLVTACKA